MTHGHMKWFLCFFKRWKGGIPEVTKVMLKPTEFYDDFEINYVEDKITQLIDSVRIFFHELPCKEWL